MNQQTTKKDQSNVIIEKKASCKLCKKNRDVRNSHIIPDSIWDAVYDKKHRALPVWQEKTPLKFMQTGVKEKLLCDECEGKFSKWETILKRDLRDIGQKRSNFLEINQIRSDLILVRNIRYIEFKLAILSILWRMSISSDSFFEGYHLGPYEEKLRMILFNEKFIDEKEFPIMVSRYEMNGKFYPGILMCSRPGKYENMITVQRFVIWGHRFSIFVHDKKIPRLPDDFFLRNSGSLFIDICELPKEISRKNALSRIYELDVTGMFQRMVF